MTKKQLFEVIENEGWNIQDEGDSYRIAQYSPNGEDYSFSIEKGTVKEMIYNIEQYYLDFEPEEHAEMWIPMRGERGVPRSIRALLNDADAIDSMLLSLVETLREVA